jgi:hypothetical protein
MGEYRAEQLLTSFPWWSPAVAILGLVVGIWLLRQYDFSYKLDYKIIVVVFVAVVFSTGWVLDMTGLNEVLTRRGPMQGMMRQYLEENNIQPEPLGEWRSYRGSRMIFE